MNNDSTQWLLAVEDILQTLRDAQEDYNINTQILEDTHRERGDWLHAIEFAAKYEDRAKCATQLHRCSERRRVSKEMIELLQPLVDFSAQNKGSIKALERALGAMRITAAKQADRIYTPRVIDNLKEITKSERITGK